jgi:Bacterial SH3 domain
VITNRAKQGIIMKKTIFMSVLIFLLFLSPLLSQEDKMMVIAIRASIYLDPDVESPIIETAERGAILNLLSAEKIREDWYYVSFYSEERFINFTGFVHASAVEMMYEVPEIKEKEKPAEQIKELEVIEEVLFESPKKIQVILEKTNIRAEPDFISEVIHQVQLGISLQAVGKAGEWYLVNLPPDEEGLIISGYIHQSFVQEIQEKKIVR